MKTIWIFNAGEDCKEEKENGVDKEMAYLYYSRAYPDPYFLNDKWMKAWEQARELKKRKLLNEYDTRVTSGQWNSIGPSTGIGGRILSIAINPVKTSSIFIGSAGGGLWKSYNGASNWQKVATDFPVLGVPSVIINPSDTNEIYAGTGEVYRYDTSAGGTALPNNQGFNVWKARGTFGVGILKSSDGGNTWSQVLTKSISGLFGIERMRFNPLNPNTVYACATDGLYRTLNAGTTWTRILALTYVSDVVINAKDTNQIVVGVGNFSNSVKGVFRSTDNGVTWTKITSGLPASFQGYIKMDNLSKVGSRDTIIASIGVAETGTGSSTELYRSTNFGSTWTALSNTQHTQWQYWCAHAIAINPSNSDALLFGGVKSYRYTISTSTKSSAAASVHDDVHDIKFDPVTTTTAYTACDGGIYKSTNSGSTWTQMDNGLSATQFYASLGSSTLSTLIVGGLQDNGEWYYNGSTWSNVGGADGAACLIDPGNDNHLIVSYDARSVSVSNTGFGGITWNASGGNALSYLGGAYDSRTAFVAPMAISKKKPDVVYVGSDNIHVSTTAFSGSPAFSNASIASSTGYIEAKHKTAVAMAVSPSDPNGDTLWVSTSPFAQADNDVDSIFVTGSPNFFVVQNASTGTTYPLSADPKTKNVMSGLPNRFVTDIAISPTYPDSVFVVVGGFGTSHVYVTGNRGTTWTAIGAGLPDVPFNAILIDPVNPKVLYAGGDMGVYVSPDRGNNWYDFNTGFTDVVQVMDIQPAYGGVNTINLVVATHGQGAFTGPRYTVTLPVHMISFTGEAQQSYNKLQWKVVREINMSRYEVERSTDGFNFRKIASLSSGNNLGQTTYSYNDPVNNDAAYYYRIKTVNSDESYEYSNVVFIKRNSKECMLVLGNPFNSSINIKLSVTTTGPAQINLYNSNGQLIRKQQTQVINGQNDLSMRNTSQLPEGIYYIEAIVNNQRWSQRLLKK